MDLEKWIYYGFSFTLFFFLVWWVYESIKTEKIMQKYHNDLIEKTEEILRESGGSVMTTN